MYNFEKTEKYQIGGKEVTFVTINEIAKKCKRKSDSLIVLEKKGVLPEANYRSPTYTSLTGALIKGKRLYSVQLAEKLIPIFCLKIKQGIKIDVLVVNELKILFNNESSYF